LELPKPIYRDFVLEELAAWREKGLKTALVTLVATTGTSPRPVGSQLAVCETGESLGLITGGCAEAALVRDALDAIKRGENHSELYGAGSRFKDIVLPCGSGLTIHFDVKLSDADIAGVIAARRARQISTLLTGGYNRRYLPACRLVCAGRGPIVEALSQMAELVEIESVIYSPDMKGVNCHPLTSADDFDVTTLDRFSALVLVFHDHGLEPDILHKALSADSFFMGALGSRKAQNARLETLVTRGVVENDLVRIHGPVGLDIGAATPPEIALSIVSQVVSEWRKIVVPVYSRPSNSRHA